MNVELTLTGDFRNPRLRNLAEHLVAVVRRECEEAVADVESAFLSVTAAKETRNDPLVSCFPAHEHFVPVHVADTVDLILSVHIPGPEGEGA